jgi:hypothetical protein
LEEAAVILGLGGVHDSRLNRRVSSLAWFRLDHGSDYLLYWFSSQRWNTHAVSCGVFNATLPQAILFYTPLADLFTERLCTLWAAQIWTVTGLTNRWGS